MIYKKIMLPIIAIILLSFIPISLAQTTSSNCTISVLSRKCVGKYLLVDIQDSNCASNWRIDYYCPYGCEYGQCLSSNPLPVIQIQKSFDVPKGSSLIFMTIKNIGATWGTVDLKAEGKAASWLSLPDKVTLDVNETKDIPIVVNVPENASGKYTFVIQASGAANYYAPSSIVVPGKNYMSISADVEKSSIAVSIIFIAAVLILWYYYKERTNGKKEEILS